MKFKSLFILALTGAAILTVYSCTKDGRDAAYYTDKTDCTASTPTYTANVQPILNASCALSGCHNASSRRAGVQLDNYTNAANEFTNGASLCTINHDCTPMPENSAKLPQSTIDLLTCWVKNGCPN